MDEKRQGRAMSNKQARKEMSQAYKEQLSHGGIYTITNSVNGKYLLDHTADIKSTRNRFQWAVSTGTALHPKLQKDWKELGASVFTMEILEEVQQTSEQSPSAFQDQLKARERFWREQLDAAKSYSS
jgi:hypothetical protein